MRRPRRDRHAGSAAAPGVLDGEEQHPMLPGTGRAVRRGRVDDRGARPGPGTGHGRTLHFGYIPVGVREASRATDGRPGQKLARPASRHRLPPGGWPDPIPAGCYQRVHRTVAAARSPALPRPPDNPATPSLFLLLDLGGLAATSTCTTVLPGDRRPDGDAAAEPTATCSASCARQRGRAPPGERGTVTLRHGAEGHRRPTRPLVTGRPDDRRPAVRRTRLDNVERPGLRG